MTQNTSSAVMQQRTEAHDSLDDFPTPPWATRALVEHVLSPTIAQSTRIPLVSTSSVWEPCSNRGYMAKALKEDFKYLHTSDIHDYSEDPTTVLCQDRVVDFLWPGTEPSTYARNGIDWIITNPPFRLAMQIIKRGIEVSRWGVAVLVRSAFEEGIDRYEELFCQLPPTVMGVFTERVIMHKGVLRDPSKLYLDERTGEMKRPSTATSYKWMVWIDGMAPRPQIWIPPCRRQLERPGDYPNG